MSCKYIPMYIDRRVFVTGKESILNTHNFVEAGFLPRGGEANDVLVKCTSKDYHTKWDSLLNILTPLLPTLLQGLYTFENALTESPNFTVKWGGNLTINTSIDGLNLYGVSFKNLNGFNVGTNASDITLSTTTGDIVIESDDILELQGKNEIRIVTPNVTNTTATAGQVLQLIDQTTGESEWQSYINKCEVLHFFDNPLNVTVPDGTILPSTYLADNYLLLGNTLSTDGSYIEVEAVQTVTGTSGAVPQLVIGLGLGLSPLVKYTRNPPDHQFTHIAKGKIFRTSSTTVYLSIEGNIYDPTGERINSYYDYQSGSFNWISNANIVCNFNLGIGDHVSELKHFSITKFLK